MTALVWAVALSVLSAVCYAAAAVAQEHFAGAERGLLRWVGPLLLTGAGAGLHVVALQFGTVGVVQALGALTLIFALPIAAARTRRRVTGAEWRQAWLTVGGLAGLLTLSTAGAGSLSATTAQGLLVVTVLTVVGIVAAAGRSAAAATRSLLLAGAAGVAFGVSSVLTKAVMSDLGTGLTGTSMLSAGAIVGLAAAGQILSQRSYRDAGLAAPLAMVSVANPVVAGTIGFLLLGDGVRFGAVGALLVAGAALAITRGVIGLAAQPAALVEANGPAPAAAPEPDRTRVVDYTGAWIADHSEARIADRTYVRIADHTEARGTDRIETWIADHSDALVADRTDAVLPASGPRRMPHTAVELPHAGQGRRAVWAVTGPLPRQAEPVPV